MHMRFTHSVFVLSVVLSSVTGCALTPSDIHPPENPVVTTATQGRAREVLVVGPFIDERPDASCGKKTNGWGMTTSHIDCATPPGAWVADSIEDGFRKNGYTILPRGTAPHAETIVVYGSIKEFFVSPETDVQDTTNELRVRMNLDVKLPHGDSAEREFTVVGTSPMTAEDNQGYDKAAHSATMQLVTATVEAVGELVERPESANENHWHVPVDEKVKPLLEASR